MNFTRALRHQAEIIDSTNIADVEDVKFVINFDYPSNSEDYVHRIGRTGRSQRTGTAYTFFTPSNANKAADLVSVLKEAKQVINPKLQEMADNRNWSNGNGGGRGTLKLFRDFQTISSELPSSQVQFTCAKSI